MHNKDLNMLPGHTNVGDAAWDAVARLGRFGGAPSESREFTQWSCHKWTAPDGTEYKMSEGHSEYMNKGYTSTHNQGRHPHRTTASRFPTRARLCPIP